MTLSARQLATANARRAKLVKICSSLPEVEIQTLGEHLGMRIRKKSLAYYQFDHHGDGMISLVCKSNANEQCRLIQSDPETFFVPACVGQRVDWHASGPGRGRLGDSGRPIEARLSRNRAEKIGCVD